MKEEIICPNCGAPIEKDSVKCPYCGYINEEGAEKKFQEDLSEIKDDIADLAKGNYLVYGTDGLLTKVNDASAYALAFRIIEKTAYKGSGILAVVICG